MQTKPISKPTRDTLDLLRQRQGWAGRLSELADHLDRSDRALLRAIYTHGMSASDVATAIEKKPRALRKRVHRLVEHITSRDFQFVLAHRHSWPRLRRRVATAIVLQRKSQRDTAADLGVSVHRVRRELEHVRALASAGADSSTSWLTTGVASCAQ